MPAWAALAGCRSCGRTHGGEHAAPGAILLVTVGGALDLGAGQAPQRLPGELQVGTRSFDPFHDLPPRVRAIPFIQPISLFLDSFKCFLRRNSPYTCRARRSHADSVAAGCAGAVS